MPEKLRSFIIVDDDPINNMLCKRVIQRVIPDADVITFTDPETGLEYLFSKYSEPGTDKAVLFLDINMPSMTGWEFMEQFERAGTSVKEKLSVYILSSSVIAVDKEKAKANSNILSYLEKPLAADVVKSFL